MKKIGIRYTVKGDVVTRHVSFGRAERTSSLRLPAWVDRNQDAGALYDQTWLASKREPELRTAKGEIRTVDLFCGCGGLSLGVVEAARALGYRLRSVFASHINKMNATALATATMARMSKDESVAMDVLVRICDVLKCDVGDIMEIHPELHAEEGSIKS